MPQRFTVLQCVWPCQTKELPEGLQLSSFQGPDDSLCAMLRLSDGHSADEKGLMRLLGLVDVGDWYS